MVCRVIVLHSCLYVQTCFHFFSLLHIATNRETKLSDAKDHFPSTVCAECLCQATKHWPITSHNKILSFLSSVLLHSYLEKQDSCSILTDTLKSHLLGSVRCWWGLHSLIFLNFACFAAHVVEACSYRQPSGTLRCLYEGSEIVYTNTKTLKMCFQIWKWLRSGYRNFQEARMMFLWLGIETLPHIIPHRSICIRENLWKG